MSSFRDAYNALVGRIEALLPNHRRLDNPNDVEKNNNKVLALAWGLRIGAAENSAREFNSLSMRRDMILILTQSQDGRKEDGADKALNELALFDDQLLVTKDVQKDGTLGLTNGTSISFVGSDGGIEPVFTDKESFIKLETNFAIENFESL